MAIRGFKKGNHVHDTRVSQTLVCSFASYLLLGHHGGTGLNRTTSRMPNSRSRWRCPRRLQPPSHHRHRYRRDHRTGGAAGEHGFPAHRPALSTTIAPNGGHDHLLDHDGR